MTRPLALMALYFGALSVIDGTTWGLVAGLAVIVAASLLLFATRETPTMEERARAWEACRDLREPGTRAPEDLRGLPRWMR